MHACSVPGRLAHESACMHTSVVVIVVVVIVVVVVVPVVVVVVVACMHACMHTSACMQLLHAVVLASSRYMKALASSRYMKVCVEGVCRRCV